MSPTRLLGLIGLIGIFVGLYLIRFYTSRPSFQAGDKLKIKGQISSDPTHLGKREQIQVGLFKIYTESAEDYIYGDIIQAEGEAKKTKYGWNLENAKVSRVGTSSDRLIIFKAREQVVNFYKKLLPEPHASLLAGVVLGTKSSLDKNFFERLRKTGTLHIVVASGTNISIFAGSFLETLAVYVSRRRAVVITIALAWMYVLIVGFQPPIVRAAVMASIALAATAFGREANSLRALALTGALLLLVKPDWLFDIGFRLSVLATVGVVVVGPWFARRLSRVPQILRQDLATSFGAQLAVSPLIYFSFGQVSLSGPLVNVLVLWTVPFMMAGGAVLAVCALLGGLGEALGWFVSWFVWLPLEYFVRVVGIFGGYD